jgi:AcrR family transcriptional regulator
MSPRGVAIPDLREHLFQAAERVLAREGPSGLTSRAITLEAGVAKGILHNHFTDLDEFLAELMIQRFRRIAEEVAKLPARAGEGTVDGNLADAVVSVFQAHAAPMISLAMARPTLMHRLQHSAAAWSPSLQHIEATFATYLQAEQQLGRLSPAADTATLALAIIGTVHHLFLTHRADPADLSGGVHRIVAALLAGVATDSRASQRGCP